ncbi:hypothetical protein HZB89_00320, partial [archaeon]|nr:hypothetical protein [archaeon]
MAHGLIGFIKPLPALFLVLIFSSHAFSAVLADSTQADFDAGDYNFTDFNSSIEGVALVQGITSGTFASRIFDAGFDYQAPANWLSLSFTSGRAYGQGFPGNQGIEPDINMASNVLLLHLNESSGKIIDSSGQGNDGNQNGGITYGAKGKFGSALNFDGNNDLISIPYSASLQPGTGSFTVEAWFKTGIG